MTFQSAGFYHNSNASGPNSNDTRATAAVRKTKPRGRPKKELVLGTAADDRRARVRQAQEVFRLRKKAAAQSLDQRNHVLEDCLEQMSLAFVEFTGAILSKPGVLKEHPDIGRQMLEATSKIVSLAQTATSESDLRSTLEGHREGNESHSMTVSLSDSRDTSAIASNVANDRMPSREPSSAISIDAWDLDTANPSFHGTVFQETLLDSSNKAFESSPIPVNIFGNGWFGRKPNIPAMNTATSHHTMGPNKDDSMSIRLLRTAMITGYDSLLGDTQNPTALGLKLFRYALLYHSRAELLFNLRWFLGPGASEFHILTRAKVGLNAYYTAFPFAFGPTHILSPFVDNSAQENVGGFMNAHEIEQYIERRSISLVNHDYMDIEFYEDNLQEDEFLSRSSQQQHGSIPIYQTGSPNPEYLPSEQLGLNGSPSIDPAMAILRTPLSLDPQFPTFHFEPLISSPEDHLYASKTMSAVAGIALSNTQETFGFDPPLEDRQRGYAEAAHASTANSRRITINLSLLMHRLSQMCFCLGNGPAFPRGLLRQAIITSTVDLAGMV